MLPGGQYIFTYYSATIQMATEHVDGKILLERYNNINTLTAALKANPYSLSYHDDDLSDKFGAYLAGRGFPPIRLTEIGARLHDYDVNFGKALVEWGDDTDGLFLGATRDPVIVQRYNEIGEQGWEESVYGTGREGKGIMGYLFSPVIIEAGEFEGGDDSTTDLAKYLAGAGLTTAELTTAAGLVRIAQLYKRFEAAGSPEMLGAFVQGFVDSAGEVD